jgi:hypothetical protein
MALKFIEGFDDGLITLRGWVDPTLNTGRFGGKCWSPGQTGHQTLNLPVPLTGTLVVGFAFQHNTAVAEDVFAMGSLHLVITAGGAIQLYNNGTTLVATSPNAPWAAVGTWRYVEAKYVLSTGAVTVRVDAVTVMTGTVGTATSIATLNWQLNNNFATFSVGVDDVYILDTTGTLNNDFLGDVRVQTLLPNADGTYSQLTPSTGTTHNTLVNEAAPNTTTYVSSSTPGQKDSYQFDDLAANTANVYGVEITNYSHKDAAGPAGFSNLVRVGGTDYLSTSQPLATSWVPNRDILDANPATSAAWTASDVNNAEFGVQTT